jgi:hypothetical protein
VPIFRYSDPGGIEEPATLVALSSNVRHGDFALTNGAMVGDVTNSTILLDDAAGVLDLQGLRAFDVRELAAPSNNQVIFRGVIQDRTVSRSAERSALTAAARIWSVDLSDYNWHLGKRLLVDQDSDRPAETIGDRLRWLINRAAHVNINDYGNVTYPSRQMEPNDYRLQRPLDVLNDCVIEDNYNTWVDFNEAHGKPELFFINPNSADYASTIAVSNVMEDVDSSTVFAPYKDATLTRSASRIAFGAAVSYPDGFEYRRKDSTGAQFGKLDQVAPMENVKSATRAGRLAQKFVNDNDEETDVIECSIKVPRASVNAVRHGHNINVKFSHLPGYEDYVRMRVLERTVVQEPEGGDTHYLIHLKMTGPVGGDAEGGGSEGEPQATAGIVLYSPDDDNPGGATSHPLIWHDTGDAPAPGQPTLPGDLTSFAYVEDSPGKYSGFEVLATSGTLNLYALFSFINVSSTSPHTYTARIKQNGVVVASQAIIKTGGVRADTGTFNFTASGIPVVAGDTFSVDMTTSVLSGLTVPFGAGDVYTFRILPSSVVIP